MNSICSEQKKKNGSQTDQECLQLSKMMLGYNKSGLKSNIVIALDLYKINTQKETLAPSPLKLLP